MTNFQITSFSPANGAGIPARIGALLVTAVLLASTGMTARAADLGFDRGLSGPVVGGNAQFEKLQQIKAAFDQRLAVLSNVLCHEETSRFEQKGSATVAKGTLETNVEILNGAEKYSSIRMDNKVFQDMQHVPGSWATGEMATLILITRDAINSRTVQIGEESLPDLGKTVVMDFSYAANSMRWYMKQKSKLHWMPFAGRVWVSPETGEILRISWQSNGLPVDMGVSEVLWTVDFNTVDISSRSLTLPTEARYQVTYTGAPNHVDRNVTHFSGYRLYGADSDIRFDDPQGPESIVAGSQNADIRDQVSADEQKAGALAVLPAGAF